MNDDPFDSFDDDRPEDPRLDLYKDDGWTNTDLLERRHITDGQYAGPKDEAEQ